MCELFGLSSKEKVRPSLMLKEFFSHAADNPHGWGAAVFSKGEAEIVKEPLSALASRKAEDFAEAAPDTELIIAHIRLATKGQVTMDNTHPFVMKDRSGTEWVLAHNGTIFGSDALSGYVHTQIGETDSERILMYIIDSLNEKLRGSRKGSDAQAISRLSSEDPQGNAAALTTDEKISVIEKVIKDITDDNKVNILLSEGQFLYAHTNYRGSLKALSANGIAAVSSKPLEAVSPEGWEELPVNTLMVYRKGQLIYRGVPHENEYFEDEERTRALFLDYANM